MVKDILASHEERMKKSIEALKHEFASLRAGRATPSLLDKVMVNYYGAPTPVNQIAKVSVPEPRMIMIQPWEKSVLHDIEVAIMKSDLGLSPNSDGTAIRLSIPALTQERRQELVTTVNKKTEEAKASSSLAPARAIRTSRRTRRLLCALLRSKPMSSSWPRRVRMASMTAIRTRMPMRRSLIR